jgi:hypothetical protein
MNWGVTKFVEDGEVAAHAMKEKVFSRVATGKVIYDGNNGQYVQK